MHPFQRSIVSGLLIMINAAALSYMLITDGSLLPWPMWLGWLGLMLAWWSYGVRRSAAESRLRREQYVAAITAALPTTLVTPSLPSQGRDHD